LGPAWINSDLSAQNLRWSHKESDCKARGKLSWYGDEVLWEECSAHSGLIFIHSNFPLGFGLGSQYPYCLLHIYQVMRTYPWQFVLLGCDFHTGKHTTKEYSAVTFNHILPKFIVINLFNGIFLLHYVYISYILINFRSTHVILRILEFTNTVHQTF